MEKQIFDANIIEVYFAKLDATVWVKKIPYYNGISVEKALDLSGFNKDFTGLYTWQELGVSVFGKRVKREHLLRPNDRIELCRRLSFDPKESRKRRAEISKMGILKGRQRYRRIIFDNYQADD